MKLNDFHTCSLCKYVSLNRPAVTVLFPKCKHQKPLHLAKLSIGTTMSAWRIIFLGNFCEDVGQLMPEQQNSWSYSQRTWFQQTWTTSNTSLSQICLSRKGNLNWPPHSPNLTFMNFVKYEYLKTKLYTNKSDSLAFK